MDQNSSGGAALLQDLLHRCQILQEELASFEKFVEKAKSEGPKSKYERAVDTKHFANMVQNERRLLDKIPYIWQNVRSWRKYLFHKFSTADLESEKTVHMLKSSNLPFYAAIWDCAKSSRSLVTFHKRFYWDGKPNRRSKQPQNRAALVDIVTHDGEEWIKVCTATTERLARDLAKARWEFADSSEEDEEGQAGHRQGTGSNANDGLKDDEYERMELVKQAVDLQRASRAHRIHYNYPRVRMMLCKISGPLPTDVSNLLDRIRSKEVIVDVLEDVKPSTSLELETDVFPNLLPAPHPPLTTKLNIDCTILLALVSDLSYAANFPISPTFNAAIRRQIELESQDHLLPLSLWPGLANKELVCTTEAFNRMKEIVDTIGTPTERARTELLMEDGDISSITDYSSLKQPSSPDELRASLQGFSDYQVPESFRIPIKVQKAPAVSEISGIINDGRLPAVAQRIAQDLTDINRSVFLFGWVHSLTTVTSNRTAVRAIERILEHHAPDQRGPEYWLREPARSLIGKEKERRK